MLLSVYYFFFVKQKTAYEMRISDWSSDVCSSDLTQFLEHLFDRLPHGLQCRPVDCRIRHFREHVPGLREDRLAAVARQHVPDLVGGVRQIGRASCRERVCQYV